ncbi:hypothetical protein [Cobetia amphilecti]|uniref:hypothetical protein n=1 Tax=Cobetia amphilecti TaxID=1055104 RepID=UPI00329A48C5
MFISLARTVLERTGLAHTAAKLKPAGLAGHRVLVEAPMASSCRELCWQLAAAGAALILVEREGDDLALLCRLLPTPSGQQHRRLSLTHADVRGDALCTQLHNIPASESPDTLLSLPGDGRWHLESGRAWHVLERGGWPAEVRAKVLECLELYGSADSRRPLLELIVQADGDFFVPLATAKHSRIRLHTPALITGEEDPLLMRLARHQGNHPVSVARQARKLIFRLRLARAGHPLAYGWLMAGEALRRVIGGPRRMLERGALGLREQRMLLTARLARWRHARHQGRRARSGV